MIIAKSILRLFANYLYFDWTYRNVLNISIVKGLLRFNAKGSFSASSKEIKAFRLFFR